MSVHYNSTVVAEDQRDVGQCWEFMIQANSAPDVTTDLWKRNGIEFIEHNKDRPSFLYFAYNGPYSLGKLMGTRAYNRHAENYRDHHFTSFPIDAMHPWQFHNKSFHTYADPQYDLPKGGRSKAKRVTTEFR